jgi:DNA-binding transcriptional regulator PaaX
MPEKWLMLTYTLPREPSRLRVSVWRKLKKLGAVSLAQSMWVLPDLDGCREALDILKDEISAEGGESFLMSASIDAKSEQDFIARFGAARDEEYTELLEQCSDFLRELEKETEKCNFSFAEIEENEADLEKLKTWYHTIEARDFFGASLRRESAESLASCAAELEAFCLKAYENSKDLRQE